jgi:hypothetical protein
MSVIIRRMRSAVVFAREGVYIAVALAACSFPVCSSPAVSDMMSYDFTWVS